MTDVEKKVYNNSNRTAVTFIYKKQQQLITKNNYSVPCTLN